MLLDARLWLLIGLSLAILFTIEAIEDFVEGSWPQMRRVEDGWGPFAELRTLWVGVAGFMLPGLVLTILNLGILVVRDLPHSSLQLLGSIFIVVGWIAFLLMTTNAAGVASYFRQVGNVMPAALILMLAVGDILLMVTLVEIFPRDVGSLIPVLSNE